MDPIKDSEQVASTIIASEKSTHRVECFILDKLIKHPDADSLSIIKIAETDFTYVARTDDWKDHLGKLVAWVPPDSIVDIARPEFKFLADNKSGPRVRAKKLRGVVSYGILVLAPEGLKPGDDAAKILAVEHYDPEASSENSGDSKNKKVKLTGLAPGEVAPAPKGVYPRYDVDAFLKYGKKVFKEGELVYLTEKLHGSSSRFVFRDGAMHCGSRNEWKREWTTPPKITLEELVQKIGDPVKAQEIYDRAMNGFKPKKSTWWSIIETNPSIQAFCEAHPGWCLYGEVFGNNKNFRYGSKDGELLFRAFDILVTTEIVPRWLDAQEFMDICDKYNIPRVPVLGIEPFEFTKMVSLAEGNTTFSNASHIREGLVIKPIKERFSEYLGRVCLKIINPKFLEIN